MDDAGTNVRRPSDGADEDEIRQAERRLEQALSSPDPTAWVYEYTEDAVFDGGGHAVQGRAALLEMAAAMQPLSEVSIRPPAYRGIGQSGDGLVRRLVGQRPSRVAVCHGGARHDPVAQGGRRPLADRLRAHRLIADERGLRLSRVPRRRA